MPGTATKKVTPSFLPRLLQERDSVSDPKLACIGMAIVSTTWVLVVKRYLTIVSAQQHLGRNRVGAVVNKSFEELRNGRCCDLSCKRDYSGLYAHQGRRVALVDKP